MYADKVKQKEANRRAKAKFKAKQGIPAGIPKEQGIPGIPAGIPDVRSLGIPLSPTGSTCDSFESLPRDVQDSIDSLGRWSKAKGIEDDREARIDRAIHYQQYVRAG